MRQKFILSERAILFIKKYILTELKITSKIGEDTLDEIQDKAIEWELEMIDNNGMDKADSYKDKERNEMADNFVSELTGKWAENEPDYDDLNARLGLI